MGPKLETVNSRCLSSRSDVQAPGFTTGPPAFPLDLPPRVTHEHPALPRAVPRYPGTPDSPGPLRLGPGTRNHVCSPAYSPRVTVTHGRPAPPRARLRISRAITPKVTHEVPTAQAAGTLRIPARLSRPVRQRRHHCFGDLDSHCVQSRSDARAAPCGPAYISFWTLMLGSDARAPRADHGPTVFPTLACRLPYPPEPPAGALGP